MTLTKRFLLATGVAALGFAALEIGGQLGGSETPIVATPAQAVVGRPLTPVSVAGVSRRTSRRTARRVSRRN